MFPRIKPPNRSRRMWYPHHHSPNRRCSIESGDGPQGIGMPFWTVRGDE